MKLIIKTHSKNNTNKFQQKKMINLSDILHMILYSETENFILIFKWVYLKCSFTGISFQKLYRTKKISSLEANRAYQQSIEKGRDPNLKGPEGRGMEIAEKGRDEERA